MTSSCEKWWVFATYHNEHHLKKRDAWCSCAQSAPWAYASGTRSWTTLGTTASCKTGRGQCRISFVVKHRTCDGLAVFHGRNDDKQVRNASLLHTSILTRAHQKRWQDSHVQKPTVLIPNTRISELLLPWHHLPELEAFLYHDYVLHTTGSDSSDYNACWVSAASLRVTCIIATNLQYNKLSNISA